jgi:hypothetical protein
MSRDGNPFTDQRGMKDGKTPSMKYIEKVWTVQFKNIAGIPSYVFSLNAKYDRKGSFAEQGDCNVRCYNQVPFPIRCLLSCLIGFDKPCWFGQWYLDPATFGEEEVAAVLLLEYELLYKKLFHGIEQASFNGGIKSKGWFN